MGGGGAVTFVDARLRPAVARVRPHALLLLALAATVFGVIVALRAQPEVFADDAAITARYAERLATGHGWTYNDGDRTNGASAPLYTMVVALLRWFGVDTIDAMRHLATVAYAASIGLVVHLAGRIGGLAAGALAGAVLVSWSDYEAQALSGMESALAVVLGLAVLIALLDDRETLAGVLLGLALLNKLDAGFLAVAVGVAVLIVRRRPPWRLAFISGAILAPWLAFSTWYFGSPLPNSMTQKVGGEVVNPGWEHDPLWVLRGFNASSTIPLVVLAISSVAVVPLLVRARRLGAATSLLACVGWGAAHGLAFSLVPLGDAYPWYRTVLFPTVAVGSAVAIVAVGELVLARLHVRPWLLRRAALGGLVLATLLAIQVQNGAGRTLAGTLRHGHVTTQYEAFEVQRREAGRHLGRVAEPGDVIATCFGWVAYGAIENPILETCPLNTREPVADPRWMTLVVYPGTGAPEVPPDWRLDASFVSTVGEGGRVDVLVRQP